MTTHSISLAISTDIRGFAYHVTLIARLLRRTERSADGLRKRFGQEDARV